MASIAWGSKSAPFKKGVSGNEHSNHAWEEFSCQPCHRRDRLSVMYITKATTLPRSLGICLGKMKSDALTNQLVTFARGLRQALPVNDRDLPAATLNQSRVFQLSGRIRDGGPLGA